ncbi:MAG: ABC transporter ATP-binding protein [Candidatus Hadarchaeales archaeon]
MKIVIKGLFFGYGSLSVLEEVELEAEKGEITSLVGPNGSGKTTLLRCVAGILKPQRGSIFLDGKEMGEFTPRELSRKIGYLPQGPSPSFPLTVFDTVLLGRKPYLGWRVGEKDLKVVSEILERVGLEKLALRPFNELSGGEKQKVLLARVLAQEPEILLLDEPTSNLDLRHQLELLNLIRKEVKRKGLSALMALHDLNLASTFSDRIVLLKKGRIFAIGRPEEVLTPSNLERVYGVKVERIKRPWGFHLLPLRPSKSNLK